MEHITALFVTLALGLFLLIGASFVFLVKRQDKFLTFSLALTFSVILMLIVTDLLPEAIENFEATSLSLLWLLLFILGGFVLLKVFDHFIPDHEDDPKKKELAKNLSHIGFVASIALILHNIIEGMAVYSTVQESLSTGLLVSLGVGLHNIPLGMVITSTFYESKGSKKKTMLFLSLLSLSTFTGGLLGFLLQDHFVSPFAIGALLAVTTGMLLYIAILELLPKVWKERNHPLTWWGLLVGAVLIGVTLFL